MSEATMKHSHCIQCLRMNCVERVDDVTSCSMTYCENDCGARFHSCKTPEHKMFCEKEKVPCINKVNGCPLEIIREKMGSHLPICPASVIVCSREWNRWPMHSNEKGWKAPMPFKHPHVRCGQLDVAFALDDQRKLIESFKTPKKTRKSLLNPMTQGYPAVPIASYSSVDESTSSELSPHSDDDSDTPWDLSQAPPGLQSTISNKLSSDNQLYAAAKEASESLVKSLDYVTGKQGLKRLSELAHNDEVARKKLEQLEAEKMNEKMEASNTGSSVHRIHNANIPIVDDDKKESDDSAVKPTTQEDDELDIYYEEKKLYEVLGLDLSTSFISSYQAKPRKMFTFLCGREFRRDQYASHERNYHCDIQCNLDNWFEQRCPLSYAGCTFSFVRFKPKKPSGALVHSSVLQTVGLSTEEEFLPDQDHVSVQLTDDEDIRTVVGRNRLREATPEIHTSFNCDSLVRVIPRYKSLSREVSPGMCQWDSGYSSQHNLADLPFEILQNIARNLDNFSIQHLSMTCKRLQSVCCSLLDELGIVTAVWVKSKPGELPEGSHMWNIAHKRWFFSTGFTPVSEWEYTEGSLSAIHEHLKVCLYNQSEHQNIKTEPSQYVSLQDTSSQ